MHRPPLSQRPGAETHGTRLAPESPTDSARELRGCSRSTVFHALAFLAWLLAIGISPASRAQWLTQDFALQAGWNSVYFHVDTSHATIDQLLAASPGHPIEEIWLWTPSPSDANALTTQQSPAEAQYWAHWTRGGGPADNLSRLYGNVACLIRTTADFTWRVAGIPVAPTYRWTVSGLNFIGFPSLTDNGGPLFTNYFAPNLGLLDSGTWSTYEGGNSSTPASLTSFDTARVQRGKAYWVKSPTESFNRYFAPFEIESPGSQGLRFDESGSRISVRLRNVTRETRTVRLVRVESEARPAHATAQQPAVRGPLPLLVRGDREGDLFEARHKALPLESSPQTWTLQPKGDVGSEIEIVVGVDRPRLSGNPGDYYAAILRFTDADGLARIDVPASAVKASTAGLWVGNAILSSVDHSLVPYAKATNAVHFTNVLASLGRAENQDGFHYEWVSGTGRILVFNTNTTPPIHGRYLRLGDEKTTPGTTARPYPIRLIVHHDGTSQARLLQAIYHGPDTGGQTVLATAQSALDPAKLAAARRISSVHFPIRTNGWNFAWTLEPGTSAQVLVALDRNDARSNPFVHAFHPDHDGIQPDYKSLQESGAETYDVDRTITLAVDPTSDDFESRTEATTTKRGNYWELVSIPGRGGSGVPAKEYGCSGAFELRRISDIPSLVTWGNP